MNGGDGTFHFWSQETDADYHSSWSLMRSLREDVVTVSHTNSTVALLHVLRSNFKMSFQKEKVSDDFADPPTEMLDKAIGKGINIKNVKLTEESLEFYRNVDAD